MTGDSQPRPELPAGPRAAGGAEPRDAEPPVRPGHQGRPPRPLLHTEVQEEICHHAFVQTDLDYSRYSRYIINILHTIQYRSLRHSWGG